MLVIDIGVDEVSCIKYLKIFINSHLSWYDHIDYVCDKVRKNINVMTKISRFFELSLVPRFPRI